MGNSSDSENFPRLIDRVRGCIIGGVVGDAMGGPFEGQPGPLHFREHNDWSISDDSQLTLATCESITEAGEVSPEHLADRFVQWYRARRITAWVPALYRRVKDATDVIRVTSEAARD